MKTISDFKTWGRKRDSPFPGLFLHSEWLPGSGMQPKMFPVFQCCSNQTAAAHLCGKRETCQKSICCPRGFKGKNINGKRGALCLEKFKAVPEVAMATRFYLLFQVLSNYSNTGKVIIMKVGCDMQSSI